MNIRPGVSFITCATYKISQRNGRVSLSAVNGNLILHDPAINEGIS
jgi:hypothetical protein